MNNSDDNGYFHQHCFSLSFPFKQIKQYKYIGLFNASNNTNYLDLSCYNKYSIVEYFTYR